LCLVHADYYRLASFKQFPNDCQMMLCRKNRSNSLETNHDRRPRGVAACITKRL
jgi:hypothetical protein